MNSRTTGYSSGNYKNRPFAALGGNKGSKIQQQALYSAAALPRLSQTDEDGTHHINIGSNSVTELGYNLSIDAETKLTHPDFGSFVTVRGFSHWLKSKSFDDTYRNLFGRNLLTYFKENADDQNKLIENYIYYIAYAMWYKVQQNKKLAVALTESTLPFEMYHRVAIDRSRPDAGYSRVRDKIASWFIPIMDTIREALKNKIEPNFDYLIYNKDTIGAMQVKWESHKQARVAANKVPTFANQRKNIEQKAEKASVKVGRGLTSSVYQIDELAVNPGSQPVQFTDVEPIDAPSIDGVVPVNGPSLVFTLDENQLHNGPGLELATGSPVASTETSTTETVYQIEAVKQTPSLSGSDTLEVQPTAVEEVSPNIEP